ncbi:MAG: hypothetical protein R3B83_15290 [Nitrospirales bacterium]|nr:hypothetical protein [Nitrospirales bacterium]
MTSKFCYHTASKKSLKFSDNVREFQKDKGGIVSLKREKMNLREQQNSGEEFSALVLKARERQLLDYEEDVNWRGGQAGESSPTCLSKLQ